MLSCGEASGDLYAGALTRELRALDPTVTISGLGGAHFAAAGGRLIEDFRGLALTGLTEWIVKVPRLLTAMRKLEAAARSERPDAVVVIDFPDFNFRLARRMKRLGVPVVYYISPQIWAWRPKRLATIRSIADRVLVIFPFEEAIYRKGGVPVEFVGHPLMDLTTAATPRERFLAAHGLSPSAPTVAILPGSRHNEVSRILPDLLAAATRIRAAVPEAQFVVARAPHLADALFAPGSDPGRGSDPGPTPVRPRSDRAPARFVVVEGDTDNVLASADVALTASGTATVQAALHDTPMVIVYRVSPTTYWLGRRLVTVDTIGMVNLIAGEKIVPEFVQEAFTPNAVANEAIAMLTDPARARRIRDGLARVRERLGGGGASRRAAEAILQVARGRKRGK
jgi:lipid-A-disaccharide synthase